MRWAINQTSHKADAAETAVTFVNESFRESGDLHNKLLYREPAVLNRRSVVSSPALRLVSIVVRATEGTGDVVRVNLADCVDAVLLLCVLGLRPKPQTGPNGIDSSLGW